MTKKKLSETILLTEREQEFLRAYYRIADMIADLIGPHAEVVLHSLEDMDCSVVKIVNGYHTGRDVGSPVTDIALQMLQKYRKTGNVNSGSYFTLNKQGEILKSATCILSGESGEAIGLLCVNINVSLPFPDIIKTLLPEQPFSIQRQENFSSKSHDVILQSLEMVSHRIDADQSIQKNKRTRAIIYSLYNEGIFELKDSAKLVAHRLGVTRNAIYKHLREFKS